MVTANAIQQNGSYGKYYTTAIFSAEAIETAKTIFEEYRSRGVILSGSFSDWEWKLTDQISFSHSLRKKYGGGAELVTPGLL